LPWCLAASEVPRIPTRVPGRYQRSVTVGVKRPLSARILA
jgi:hypothetical protein